MSIAVQVASTPNLISVELASKAITPSPKWKPSPELSPEIILVFAFILPDDVTCPSKLALPATNQPEPVISPVE